MLRGSRLRPTRRLWRSDAAFLGCAAVAALVAAPISLERAIEGVHFSDDLGTFPVEVSLCHDGRSTLDTGLFGKVFWSRTGTLETREIAEQVRPFIDKNTKRIEADAKDYESAAGSSFAISLAARERSLVPRADETIVLAEADPQGSDVGVAVRKDLYRHLVQALGPKAISLRPISGDVSSNGTVAELGYIAREAKVSGAIPTVAVGGDHDSVETWRQLARNGVVVPDLRTDAVAGRDVAGANDREHKTLFGGMFTNASGISEQQPGAMLRSKTDADGARIVLLHQPDAVAGYLGLDDLGPVRSVHGSRTSPYDDGVPDQPPGIVDIGHLHQLGGPWVLWNTDGPEVTWTVVDQLGTAGGVENAPTFSRFSTPFSAPLKPLTVRLRYVDTESGLETGYATIRCSLDGSCRISRRADVGLPGGKPLAAADLP